MARVSKRIVLKNVRFSFLSVFRPKEDLQGRKRYSTTILIPKDHPQVSEVKSAIKSIIDECWKGKTAGLHNPLRDGDDKNDSNYGREGYAGHYFLNASTPEERAPDVVDASLNKANPADWNSGDYGNVSVVFYDFDVTTKKGVGCGLGNVQLVRKGEPLAGGPRADREFGVEAVEPEEDF
jgi:hypothetical protein